MNPRLEKQWKLHEAYLQEYFSVLETLDEQQLNYRPDPQSWSILQVAHHLLVAEKLATMFLVRKNYENTKKRAGVMDSLKSFLINISLKSPIKFKAPKIDQLSPAKEQDKDRTLSEWQQVRETLRKYLENYPQEKLDYLLFRHPRGPWLTIEQTLQFFNNHLLHHQRQVANLKTKQGL